MYKFYIAILFIMTLISIAGFVLHFTYCKSCGRESYSSRPTINNLDKSQLIEEGSITAECVLNTGRIACHNDPMITVVILNFGRPKNVEKQVNELGNHPKISEIIVGHGNPDTYQAYKHSEAVVRNIKDEDNNKKYYCLRRHLLALKASNNIIMMLDDDYIPSHQYINMMCRQYHIDPDNFCGYFSRGCNKDGYAMSYPSHPNAEWAVQKGIAGDINKHDTNIILPGVSMMGKHIIQRIWREIEKSPYLDEIAVKNKGNGEDLLFNYYFQKLYNKNPVLITGKVKHLDNLDGYSAQEEHYDIRTNLCKRFNMTGKNKIVNP